MEFIINKIEFMTDKVGLWDEYRYPVWQGEKIEIPEYETKFIMISGTLYRKNMHMELSVSYAYDQFKDLTIDEVRKEVVRRIMQGFADKKEFIERMKPDES